MLRRARVHPQRLTVFLVSRLARSMLFNRLLLGKCGARDLVCLKRLGYTAISPVRAWRYTAAGNNLIPAVLIMHPNHRL